MASFQYAARNTQGKTVTGVLEAASQALVAKQLREHGLIPTTIQEGKGGVVAKKMASCASTT